MKKERNLYKLFSLIIICFLVGFLCVPQTAVGETFHLYFNWMASWPDLRPVVDTATNRFTELCQFVFYEYDPNISAGDPNIDPRERIVDWKTFSITGPDKYTLGVGPVPPVLGYSTTAELEKGVKYALRIFPLFRLDLQDIDIDIDMEYVYQDQWYSRKRELDPNNLIWFEDEDNKSKHIYMYQGKPWLKIVLERGYTITGKLILPDGQDLENESIRVKILDENKRDTRFFSDTNFGHYVIRGLSPGNYYIVADGHPKGYVKSYYNAQDLIIIDPNKIKGLNSDLPTGFELEDFPASWEELYMNQDCWDDDMALIPGKDISIKKGKSIKGRILDPNGDPLDPSQASRLCLQIFDPDSYNCFYPNPGFQPPLRYYIHDLNYDTYPPWEKITMVYFDHCGNDPNMSFFLGGFDPNAQGDVIVQVIDPSDRYFPTFWSDGSGAYFYKDAEPINLGDLEDEQEYEIIIRLNRFPKIIGKIKDEISDEPLDNIQVTASLKGYDYGQRSAVTDPNGYYEIKFMPMDLPFDTWFSLDTQDSLDWQLFVEDVDPNRIHHYSWEYYNENGNVQYRDLASAVTISEKNVVQYVDFALQKGGRIQGCVTDKDGNPLSNIKIRALYLSSGSSFLNDCTFNDKEMVHTYTADSEHDYLPEGYYEITGLPPGRYVLEASSAKEESNYIQIYYPNSLYLNEAEAITITGSNQLVGPYNFTLKDGALIKGEIKGIPRDLEKLFRDIIQYREDPEISNSPFFQVQLIDVKSKLHVLSDNVYIDTNSDPWKYRIVGIPKGEYKLMIVDQHRPGILGQRIKDGSYITADPLKKRLLTKYYKESAYMQPDPEGAFSFESAGSIFIDPAVDPNIRIDFQWDEVGVTIEGKVKAANDNKNLLSGIDIYAYRATIDEGTGKIKERDLQPFSMVKSETGNYFLTGLPAGDYLLMAKDNSESYFAPAYYDSNCTKTVYNDEEMRMELPKAKEATLISISSEGTIIPDKTSYDFLLHHKGVIQGKVTRENLYTPSTFGKISLYSIELQEYYLTERNFIPNVEGEYTISGLPEGTYKLRVFDPNYVPTFWTSDPTATVFNLADGDPITVDYRYPDLSKNINILLTDRGAKIDVTVEKDKGSHVQLFFYQEYEGKWKPIGEYTRLQTDPNGRLADSSCRLPSGTYKVVAVNYERDYEVCFENFEVSSEAQKTIELDPNMINHEKDEEYVIELSEGLNIFSFPIQMYPTYPYVSDLITQWYYAGVIIDCLHFDSEEGEWQNKNSEFLLEDGRGYIAYTHQKRGIKYKGLLHTEDDILLYPGLNIIGNTSAGYARSFQLIEHLSGEATTLRQFDADRGKWRNSVLLWGKPAGQNFEISVKDSEKGVVIKKGYILDLKATDPRCLVIE